MWGVKESETNEAVYVWLDGVESSRQAGPALVCGEACVVCLRHAWSRMALTLETQIMY